MQKNVRMNGVYTKVVPIHGDAKEVIEERFCGIADRVLMPLPEKAYEYLPYALLALKKTGGWVHYYAVEHALRSENPLEKVRFKIAGKLENLVETFEIPFSRVVRTTGPNWYQTASDIRITSESVL
jgi:tRNA (guanine37-N1)-methyltransferase